MKKELHDEKKSYNDHSCKPRVITDALKRAKQVRMGPKEFVTMTSVRSSCKAFKMNNIILIIVLLKRDERTLCGEERLKRINVV